MLSPHTSDPRAGRVEPGRQGCLRSGPARCWSFFHGGRVVSRCKGQFASEGDHYFAATVIVDLRTANCEAKALMKPNRSIVDGAGDCPEFAASTLARMIAELFVECSSKPGLALVRSDPYKVDVGDPGSRWGDETHQETSQALLVFGNSTSCEEVIKE